MKLKPIACAVLACTTLGATTTTHAITSIESNAGIQFNFSNPGARSLGMGGAFIGLADDATAAYSNPAGLSNLFRPEFSLEYRRNEYTTQFSDRGRLYGDPTNIGIDTFDDIVSADAEDSTDALGFISFVYPKEKWTFGAYRHQIAQFESDYLSQGPIIQNRGFEQDGVPFVSRANPAENINDLDVVNWGFSLSYRISDNFSIGGGISYYDFSFSSVTTRYSIGRGVERYQEVDFTSEQTNRTTQNGDDDDIGFNVGVLWKITDKWSLGAVYRSGAEFDYAHRGESLATGDFREGVTDFNLPSSYGVGVAFRPIDQLTINFDYNRITYSDLTENVVLQGSGDPFPFLEVDDGDEFRLGAEYVFATNNPIALRAGVWQAPDTQIAYVGPLNPVEEGLPPAEILDRNRKNTRAAFFQSGDEETHVSLGFGIVFERFQLDAAADFSDRTDTYSVSGVFFF